MVKVPLYQENQDRVALRPEYTETLAGGATADAFGSAIGKGLQSVASGMETAAEAVQRVQEMRDDAVVSDAANRWLQQKDKLLYDADTGYANAEGRQAVEGFDAYRKSVESLKGNIAAKMSPAQKERFDRQVAPFEIDALRSGVIRKSEETKKWLVQEHTAAAENFSLQAIQTPDDEARWNGYVGLGVKELDARGAKEGWGKERAELERTTYISNARLQTALHIGESDAIKAAGYATRHAADITPQDHMVLLDRLKPDLKRAAGADAAHFNASNPAPGQFAATGLSHDQYALLSVISGTESPAYDMMNGGQRISDYAAHPGFIGAGGTTTATGRYQIVRGTWERAATALGLTDFSPASQDRAAAWIAQADYRTNAGRDLARDIADGNFASIRRNLATTWEGLKKISDEEFARRLAAARLAPLAAPAAAGAVPGGASAGASAPQPAATGTSAAPVAPGASATTSGAEAPPQPAGPQFSPAVESALSALPPAYAAEIRESAADAMRDAEMQQTLREKAMQVAQAEAYRQRIDNGDSTLTPRDIKEDTVVDAGDKAALIGTLDEKKKEALATSLNVAAFHAGKLAIDVYTDEGRKANDGVWAAISAHLDEPSQRDPLLLNLIRQTGAVPTAVFDDLRLKLTRGKLDGVREALDLGNRISLVDPGALARVTDGSKIADDVVLYSHYLNSIGLTPDEAAKRVIDQKDPEAVRRRAALMDDPGMKFTIDAMARTENIQWLFRKTWSSIPPRLGNSRQQEATLVSDYKEILADSISDANAHWNFESAQILASDRIQRRYGTSEFSPEGSNVVTYLPPEKTYPPDAAGSYTYIREQLNAFLAAEGITHGGAFLTADKDTEHDVAVGAPRRYQVYYKGENGDLLHYRKQFTPKPPNPGQVEAARRAALAGLEAERLENPDVQQELGAERKRAIDEMLAWPLNIPASSSPGSTPAFPDAGPLPKTKRNGPLNKTKRKN
ncbi:muramidase (phage lysozyme) [Rhizobium sp. BK650]|uniref:hypothetical protein n=1 Tax=Rhizobium sp. BK650 TaxID=2586990 RepID=UPI00160D9E9C|nr:hypothetical protein [Rhizobium sp. BK650]MBB3655819.1 muramidase (phage lysozyme) [Rhizobium sp. BK650]